MPKNTSPARATEPPRAPRMDLSAGRSVSREEVASSLGSHAPLGKETEDLLGVPGKIFAVEGALPDTISYSSDPENGAARVAGSLILGFEMPEKVPDYAIHISSRGSNIFCTLVDKERKVIVCESIRNVFSEFGSWTAFTDSLREALEASSRLQDAGRDFSFVVVKDSVPRVV